MTKFEYSAGAFIYRMDKGTALLLILKKDNGEYDLPKGHIEKGETSEIAAKREIMEEAGIDADFIYGFSAATRYFFRRGRQVIGKQVKFFLSEVKSPSVKISYEHVGYEWAARDDAVRKLKFKDLVKIAQRVFDYIEKRNKLSEINSRYEKLPLTKGWDLSRTLVPGEGCLDSGVMAIGQAPGADEDELKRPFIGRSGRLLSGMFHKAKIKRENIYITSVVQFFPPKNRLPDRNEVEMCMPFLREQMEIIKPRYVLLLGNLSAAALAGVIGSETNHGKVVEKDGITYMVILHPSAVLRFNSKYGLMLGGMKKFGQLINGKS